MLSFPFSPSPLLPCLALEHHLSAPFAFFHLPHLTYWTSPGFTRSPSSISSSHQAFGIIVGAPLHHPTTIDSTSSSLVSLLCCLFTFLLTFTFFSLFSFFFSSTVLALEHLVFAHPLPPLFPHRHCLPLSSTHSLTLIILIFQDSITIAGPSSREHLFALTTIDSTRSSLVSLFWLFDCLHFY